MSYSVVYYSNFHRPIVHNVSSLNEAEVLVRIGRDNQYLVDIEDNTIPRPLPEYTD